MKKMMQATQTEQACTTAEYEQALEDAINEIREDADRVESIIKENSDLIQELYYAYGKAYSERYIFVDLFFEMIDRKIEACAEADVEKLL